MVRLGLTMGDGAGVGPEIVVRALGEGARGVQVVVFGDEGVLEAAAAAWRRKGWDIPWRPRVAELPDDAPLVVVPVTSLADPEGLLGHPTPEVAASASRYVLAAVEAWRAGQVEALVTAPLTKAGLRRAGLPFPGHTEWLAHLTGTKRVVMMMVGPTLKVALVTTHLALRDVASALTRESIEETIVLCHEALVRDFGITEPRLAVAGLNPHLGEGGLFGDEDQTLVGPAVEGMRSRGIRVAGPLPADSVFYQAARGDYDAVVSLYHDQGLGPFKLLHFHDGVNMTLGMPLIRTSVDHGVAYDLAGKAVADHRSLQAALDLAARLAPQRRKYSAPPA